MLDARARSLYAVARAGNHHFALAHQARNHRANRIIAAVAGALRFGNRQFHEFLFGFVGRRNHREGLYLFIASAVDIGEHGTADQGISSDFTKKNEWAHEISPESVGGGRLPFSLYRHGGRNYFLLLAES